MFKKLLLFALPGIASGHGCPRFDLTDNDSLGGFLINDDAPQAFKDIASANNGTRVWGIWDCHEERGAYEIGVQAICVEGEPCTCTALYNFNECRSCELNCGADPEALDKDSFSADCSNVELDIEQVEGDCVVECGYNSTGCFAVEKATDPESSGQAVSMFGAVVGAVALFL